MENMVEAQVYSHVTIGGDSIPFITDAGINMWIVMAAIMAVTLLITRNLKPVPAGGQRVAEMMVDFISGLAKSTIGHHYKPYVPYIGTILIFLLFSNSIAIFNILPGGVLAALFGNEALEHFEILPPTRNFNVTLCLALISISVVIYSEFKYKGLRKWIKSFYTPSPVSILVKLLDYAIRPASLCLRLFGNILGGVIVMGLVYSSMPIFAPVVIGFYFDVFDGMLQAYVFVFLTSLYIAEAVEE
jgi:F-type H+-transporting ATPase subunit a